MTKFRGGARPLSRNARAIRGAETLSFVGRHQGSSTSSASSILRRRAHLLSRAATTVDASGYRNSAVRSSCSNGGQQFVMDNRPGATGNLATEAVVRAPADGYTLLLATVGDAISATFYDKLNFSFIRDVAPVASLVRGPGMMVVTPSFPAKTIREFIAYAKANPGKINMASGGPGSTSHLYGEMFKMMAGVDMIHVPYRGTPQALTDLIGGQVQVNSRPIVDSIEHIRAGRLRALAVTTTNRSELLPDIPAIGEFLPGYEASAWHGIGAPRNTPAELVELLNKQINAGLADSKMKTRIADLGYQAYATSPAEFAKFIGEETEKWAKIVKISGAKPE